MKRTLLMASMALLMFAGPSLAQLTDDNARPLLQQASLLMREGKKDEALPVFEKCLEYKLSPDHESMVRMALGSMYMKNEPEKAFQFLKRAQELDPKNSYVLPSLGLAYEHRNEFAEARKCWEQYLKEKPDGENAEQVKEMLADLDKYATEHERLDKLNKAIELFNKKEYARASELLKETAKTDHANTAKEQEILGLCLTHLGKYNEAIEAFQKCLALEPKRPNAISGLAAAYEGKGDLKLARETLKQVLSVDRSKETKTAVKDRLPMMKRVEKLGTAEGPDYFHAVSTPYISRWSMTQMPLRVYIEPTSSVANYNPEFSGSIERALNMWCTATNGKVRWTPAANDVEAEIVVRFTADPNEVGKSESHLEAGICEVSTKRMPGAKISGITKANIKLLTTTANGRAFTPQEIQDTAAHEIGHALGMREHSANADDVMYFAATKNTKDGLTERDKNTIHAVYEAQVYEDGTIIVDGKKIKRR